MLELYYSETCPYCRKVINHFKDIGINYAPKDINIKKNYDELLAKGKLAQVPFLVDTDNNKKMYESDKIILYVDNLRK